MKKSVSATDFARSAAIPPCAPASQKISTPHCSAYLLPDTVGERHFLEHRRRCLIEELAVQRCQREHIVDTALGQRHIARLWPAALGDQPKELPQSLVEVEAFARVGRVHRLIREIAQVLQAVALEIRLAGLDRHVAQLRACLDIEQKEQPVDHAQAL